jgi:hypothetical protein
MDAERVIKFLNNQGVECKFIAYEDMHEIKDIEQLAPRTLILYQLKGLNGIGHFCCFIKNSKGNIFFDSLGGQPDGTLKYMNDETSEELNHDYKYLTELLARGGGVDYNNYHLQAQDKSTCGAWCAMRLLCYELSNDEFAKCFKNIKNKDKALVKVFEDIEKGVLKY